MIDKFLFVLLMVCCYFCSRVGCFSSLLSWYLKLNYYFFFLIHTLFIGEFELMHYRISENISCPFKLFPQIDEISSTKMDIHLRVRSDFSSTLVAYDVLVNFLFFFSFFFFLFFSFFFFLFFSFFFLLSPSSSR